jgi:hypothetical protein
MVKSKKQNFFNMQANKYKIISISEYLTISGHFNMSYLTHLCVKLIKPIRLDQTLKKIKMDFHKFDCYFKTILNGNESTDFFKTNNFLKYTDSKDDNRFICSLFAKFAYDRKLDERVSIESINITILWSNLYCSFVCNWIRSSIYITRIWLIDALIDTEALKILSNIRDARNWEILCLNNNPVCTVKSIVHLVKLFPFINGLKKLELCSTELDPISASILSDSLAILSNLEEINLSNNMIEDSSNKFLSSVGALTKLSCVKLKECKLNNFSSGLGVLLSNCINLKILELSSNTINLEETLIFKNNLKNTKIIILILNDCEIGNEQAEIILNTLQTCPSVEKIYMNKNRFKGDILFSSIQEFLRINKLIKIYLTKGNYLQKFHKGEVVGTVPDKTLEEKLKKEIKNNIYY